MTERAAPNTANAMSAARFSIRRMLKGTSVVAVVAALFGSLPWPIAMLIVCIANLLAAVFFFVNKQSRVARMALATSALIFAAIALTDWGLSSPNGKVRVAWPLVIAAIASQCWTLAIWFVIPSESA
jgi:hypothetical protein